MDIDGRPVTIFGFLPVKGSIQPEVVSGRAPRGAREIALGAVTLDALHKHVGDTVHVRGTKAVRRYRVVGRIVLPMIGEAQTLADGAAMTGAGLTPLFQTGENETHFLVAHLDPGADRGAVERRFGAIPGTQNVGHVNVPVEVSRLVQVDRIPAFLAALLGFLALLAVSHALVTAVRRRRGELALLKVLGFDRRQVGATVAWQATILGTVGLVLGLPIGIVVGRLIWRLVADSLGVSTEVTMPTVWLLLSVPCVLVVVNLIAFFPARSAARTRPAVALRSP
jgi:predicted lysophospholipase L1 biosynthesis ABC-type transport system permease subunit